MNELVTQLINLMFKPYIFIPLIYPGLVVLMLVLLFIIWLERKIAGRVQLRYGPLYVCKRLGGIIQLVADLLRYFFAEVIVPEGADKLMFILAPMLLFSFAFLPVFTLPVSSTYAAINNELSLLVTLSLLTIPPMFVIIVSWASNNKFSFIGGLREGYLMISYEIAVFLSALSMALIYNTLNLIEIVERQTKVWGVIMNPVAATVFFIAILISTSKFPFEIAEADTEVVCGPYTEYSGIMYGLCMGYAYIKRYVLSLLFSLLFLGGWNPIMWPLKMKPVISGLSILSEVILPGFMVFVKGLIIMIISVFLRSVYPRYRIDQAISIGWHNLFTLSILSLIISILIVFAGRGFYG